MTITTKAQARRAANTVADLLWKAYDAGSLTYQQTVTLSDRCMDLIFDRGYTPEAAVTLAVGQVAR